MIDEMPALYLSRLLQVNVHCNSIAAAAAVAVSKNMQPKTPRELLRPRVYGALLCEPTAESLTNAVHMIMPCFLHTMYYMSGPGLGTAFLSIICTQWNIIQLADDAT